MTRRRRRPPPRPPPREVRAPAWRSGARPPRPGRPRATAVTLTGVAGCVDAVGYVTLARVFVANMSGNSVAMGLHAADGRWGEAWRRGYPVLAFVAGLLLGGAVAEVWRRRRRRGDPRTAVAVTLALEWALLAGFLAAAAATFGWRGPPGGGGGGGAAWPDAPPGAAALMVGLAAAAMGVQNVCLRAAGALSVYTTHVTGSLTRMADEAVTWGLWLFARAGARSRRPGRHGPRLRRWRRLLAAAPRHPAAREAAFLLTTWLAYVAGATAGALALGRWGVAAVAGPLALLAVVAGAQLRSNG